MHNCKFHWIIQRKMLDPYKNTSVSTHFSFQYFSIMLSREGICSYSVMLEQCSGKRWYLSFLNTDGTEMRNANFPHCVPLSELELKKQGPIFSAIYKGLMICDVDISLQLDRCHQLISHRQLDSHVIAAFFNCY